MKCIALEDVVLITEETPNEKYDNKLFPKIPIICFKEKIRFDNITELLFKYLQEEIVIKVE